MKTIYETPHQEIVRLLNETLKRLDKLKQAGLTFRERLIIALASNPEMMVNDNKIAMEFEQVAEGISLQADAIIVVELSKDFKGVRK